MGDGNLERETTMFTTILVVAALTVLAVFAVKVVVFDFAAYRAEQRRNRIG